MIASPSNPTATAPPPAGVFSLPLPLGEGRGEGSPPTPSLVPGSHDTEHRALSTEHPSPSSPPPLSPTDRTLLSALYDADEDIVGIAASCGLDEHDLIDWFDQPRIQQRLDAQRRLRHYRREVVQELHTSRALRRLSTIADSSPDPVEQRRASTTILRAIIDANRPKRPGARGASQGQGARSASEGRDFSAPRHPGATAQPLDEGQHRAPSPTQHSAPSTQHCPSPSPHTEHSAPSTEHSPSYSPPPPDEFPHRVAAHALNLLSAPEHKTPQAAADALAPFLHDDITADPDRRATFAAALERSQLLTLVADPTLRSRIRHVADDDRHARKALDFTDTAGRVRTCTLHFERLPDDDHPHARWRIRDITDSS